MRLGEQIDKAEASLGLTLPASAPTDGLALAVESRAQGRRADLADLVFDAAVERALKNLITTEHVAAEQGGHDLSPTAIAVVGLPRTGSTLLHNVLALADDVTTVSHLDAINPTWRSSVISRDDALVDVNARLELMDIMSPGIRDRHPVQHDWPDECTLLLANSGGSHQWPVMFELPEHLAWLGDADLSEDYDAYRRALSVVTDPAAGTLVLKSPFHVLRLDELRRVVPGVRVVATVRESSRVIPSWFGLVEATQAPLYGAERLDAGYVRQWTAALEAMAIATVEAAEGGEFDLVVRYEDLIRDPAGVAAQVLGRPATADPDEFAGRVGRWLAQPEAGRRGEPAPQAYEPSPSFSAYDIYFDLAAGGQG